MPTKIRHAVSPNQFIIRKCNFDMEVCKALVMPKEKIEESVKFV